MNFCERLWDALKLNRCPVLDPKDLAAKEQQERIARLYGKR